MFDSAVADLAETNQAVRAILGLPAVILNGADQDWQREAVLADAAGWTRYAVLDRLVLLRTPLGHTLISADPVVEIVEVDHVPAGGDRRIHFWMNSNSVAHLSDSLRAGRARRHAWPGPGQLEL